jgi:succinate dehydrogenase/fumarate reductase cytochrome b subunit
LTVHLLVELRHAFASDVQELQRHSPGWLELLAGAALVWLPIALHLGLGGWLLLSGRSLAPRPDASLARLPRLLSRATAALAALFLLWHARTYALAVWLSEADARDAGFRLLAELSSTRFGMPLAGAAYVAGLLATCTHAAIGIHAALLRLGRLTSEARRSRSARACAAFGVVTFCLGAAAVIRVASGVLLR